MAKIKFVIISIFLILTNISTGQNSKWENFTDLKNVTSLSTDTVTNKIYCASNGGLFVVDLSTGNVLGKYTNLNGLISNELTSLLIDNTERLWIGATDGSISILNLQTEKWNYIFDIKNSNEADKSINYLYQTGNFIFVATGYGIQKISVNSLNFVDAPYYKLGSFPNNTQVYSLTSLNNVLYAATKTGVAYANYVNSNLNNPSSWSNYNLGNLSADVRTIEASVDKVFAGSLSGFSYLSSGVWQNYPDPSVSGQNTKFIKATGVNLYFISNNNINYAPLSTLPAVKPFISISNSYSVISTDKNSNPVFGLSDNGITISMSGYSSYIFPNSPYTNSFNGITIDQDNNIWAAGGTVNSGFYKFDGTNWSNFTTATHPEIGNSNWFQKIVSGNGNVWALGFGSGPTRITGNNITNFNPSNSNMPGISNDPNFCASYGGSYDNFGVFWATFFATNTGRSLYAYNTNGEWIGYINPSIISSASLSEVAVDSYNTKWIVTSGSRSGLYFFNENGTITNPSDDVYGFYDNNDFGSEVTNVTDVIVDNNNEVWVTTNNGVFIISNPYGAILNPSSKPRPQKLGIISGNLRVPFTENCISIASDIINDKWVGSESNGVFHFSSDGTTLIDQFNTVRSPILSDRIGSIAVSNISGRAFFGTRKGLSSYATNAIEPVAEFDEIIASPNPYLVPNAVNMKIDGLVENSTIKILTINGEVVNEFDSPGGRIAFWNGMNSNNQPAATGIYIIVAFTSDGSQVGTGKVAIVNK
ncbi:MAG TPA: hypothetical protein PKA90_03880 [Ignavibacteria bacterium]|nr:hypothetical protein [Ignavibacteria bacterium]HMR39548.1 hypothetical protein [Ignavibacteria bacterium]